MSSSIRTFQQTMRSRLRPLRRWLVLFYIWSLQWMINGTLELIGMWKFPGWLPLATGIGAACLSIAILLYNPGTSTDQQEPGRLWAVLLVSVPFGILAGSLLLLEYIHAVDPFYMDFFRALLLSFGLTCLGVLFGLELLLLGVWLFGISWVVAYRFLGFAPMVLELMGGLALLSAGWMLLRWTNTRTQTN